ncbi:MAG: diacylglycerol kinase [Methylotenera sp.]|nr:diacylglycerol kinase [Methylotenera sp.]
MKNQPLSRRFKNALNGIKASWQSENSFRIQAVAVLFVVTVLLFIKPHPVWWALLLLTCGLVITLELVNTAIEKLADHLHPDQHQVLKIVKDTLAGAVFLASLFAVCIFIAFTLSVLSL